MTDHTLLPMACAALNHDDALIVFADAALERGDITGGPTRLQDALDLARRLVAEQIFPHWGRYPWACGRVRITMGELTERLADRVSVGPGASFRCAIIASIGGQEIEVARADPGQTVVLRQGEQLEVNVPDPLVTIG